MIYDVIHGDIDIYEDVNVPMIQKAYKSYRIYIFFFCK